MCDTGSRAPVFRWGGDIARLITQRRKSPLPLSYARLPKTQVICIPNKRRSTRIEGDSGRTNIRSVVLTFQEIRPVT
jgi:hypothetical protein